MNLRKEFSSYYAAADYPEIITIGKVNYVSILGEGSPGTNIFYEKKSAIKEFVDELQNEFVGTDQQFKTDIIEIFYWYDEKDGFVDIGNFYTKLNLDLLHYRIVIRIPDFITQENISSIAEKFTFIPFANQFEIFNYTAGKCVQLMHSGPFADELRTLPILQKFATDNGLMNIGMHHEIHITPFEKGQSQTHLKTILRDAVQ